MTIMLAMVQGLGFYLRLRNIEHLFSIVHDYDEVAYSLAGRAEGESIGPGSISVTADLTFVAVHCRMR